MATQDYLPFFDLRRVSKVFKLPPANPFKRRTTIIALDSVSLAIQRGKVTCLLGPNGAGKTTLLKILASLIVPDEGEILYEGAPYEGVQKGLREKIGLVTPNERAFYWRLSGRENLLFFGSLNGFRGSRLRRRVDEVLEETGMADSAAKPYRLYSAGMKQKLNIARALLGDPELYLLDEPAAHLDPLAREEFHSFIANTLIKRKGATVFLCTHDLEEARELAEAIVLLDQGKVVAQGDRRVLLNGAMSRRELSLEYAGEPPQAWLDGRDAEIRLERPGLIRVAFDPASVAQDEIIASFAASGGRIQEAYTSGDSLLDLIKRTSATHA